MGSRLIGDRAVRIAPEAGLSVWTNAQLANSVTTLKDLLNQDTTMMILDEIISDAH
jgi:hypothetical protein